ncbi:hypothetical protein ACSBR2_014983 [Camellia fascicularis]
MASDATSFNDSFTIELEEGSNESEDNSHLCLIGKILSSKVRTKQTVTRIVTGAWKTRVEVSISPWPDNVYRFGFGNEEDRALVLHIAPWSIMGHLLVLRQLEVGKAVSEMDFSFSSFWVQVHGLPMEKMTRRNGQIIGQSIGRLIGVEAPRDGLLLTYNFLRIKVDMNVTLPLSRGFLLKRQQSSSVEAKDIWVDFKYERLSDYCYDCGRIGHDHHTCKFVTKEERQLSGFGPNLRTGVGKNLGLSADFYHKQIDEIENRLQPLL